jgi:hypothetical protein
MNAYRFSVGHVKPIGSGPDPQYLDDLWGRWLAARTRAMQTGKLQDGIEAGHRWRDFLAAFVASPPLAPAE